MFTGWKFISRDLSTLILWVMHITTIVCMCVNVKWNWNIIERLLASFILKKWWPMWYIPDTKTDDQLQCIQHMYTAFQNFEIILILILQEYIQRCCSNIRLLIWLHIITLVSTRYFVLKTKRILHQMPETSNIA